MNKTSKQENIIKWLRKRLDNTQATLAIDIGITTQYLQEIENRRSPLTMPVFKAILRIAKDNHIKLTADELLKHDKMDN